MKLTTKQFWDARHESGYQPAGRDVQARKGLVRRIVDKARRRRGAQPRQTYSNFALHRLLATYLPVRPDWSVIEIGAAPGENLVSLHRNFAYRPFGVEYSHAGTVSTRETFHRYGLDPSNVIEGDFFDQGFQDKFQGSFDVVFSLGFIEHFDPPDEVLSLHVNLLKPGGYLVCQIPNLRGVSYPFLWLCARDLLKVHNCVLMRKESFRRAFEPLGLDVKFCAYVGAPRFHVGFLTHERSLRGFAASVLDRVQDIQDHCMFLFFRGQFPESRLSASLAFVGQRTS